MLILRLLSPLIGPQDPSSGLYTVNLATGAAVRVGSIGPGGGVAAFVTRDIAVPVGIAVPEPDTCGILAFGAVTLACRRRRTELAAPPGIEEAGAASRDPENPGAPAASPRRH